MSKTQTGVLESWSECWARIPKTVLSTEFLSSSFNLLNYIQHTSSHSYNIRCGLQACLKVEYLHTRGHRQGKLNSTHIYILSTYASTEPGSTDLQMSTVFVVAAVQGGTCRSHSLPWHTPVEIHRRVNVRATWKPIFAHYTLRIPVVKHIQLQPINTLYL